MIKGTHALCSSNVDLGQQIQLKQKEMELMRYKTKAAQSEKAKERELSDHKRSLQVSPVSSVKKPTPTSASLTPETRRSIDLKIKRKNDEGQGQSPKYLARAMQEFNILEKLSEDEAEEFRDESGVSLMPEVTEALTAAETSTQSSGLNVYSKKHKEVKSTFSKRNEQQPLFSPTLGKPQRPLEKQLHKSKSVIGNKQFGI